MRRRNLGPRSETAREGPAVSAAAETGGTGRSIIVIPRGTKTTRQHHTPAGIVATCDADQPRLTVRTAGTGIGFLQIGFTVRVAWRGRGDFDRQ